MYTRASLAIGAAALFHGVAATTFIDRRVHMLRWTQSNSTTVAPVPSTTAISTNPSSITETWSHTESSAQESISPITTIVSTVVVTDSLSETQQTTLPLVTFTPDSTVALETTTEVTTLEGSPTASGSVSSSDTLTTSQIKITISIRTSTESAVEPTSLTNPYTTEVVSILNPNSLPSASSIHSWNSDSSNIVISPATQTSIASETSVLPTTSLDSQVAPIPTQSSVWDDHSAVSQSTVVNPNPQTSTVTEIPALSTSNSISQVVPTSAQPSTWDDSSTEVKSTVTNPAPQTSASTSSDSTSEVVPTTTLPTSYSASNPSTSQLSTDSPLPQSSSTLVSFTNPPTQTSPPPTSTPIPTSSSAVPSSNTTLPPLLIGSQTISQGSSSNFLIGSYTVTPGADTTISGQHISVAPTGGAIIINPAPASPTTTGPPAVVVVDGTTITANSASGFVIGSQTLYPGSAITYGGEVITLPLPATKSNPTAKPTQPPIVFASSLTLTQNSASQYLIGSQTLLPGSALTVSGEVISLSPSGDAIIINGATPTSPVPSTLITATSAGSLVLAGQTLTKGGEVTVGGEVLSLAGTGTGTSVVVVGTATGKAAAATGKKGGAARRIDGQGGRTTMMLLLGGISFVISRLF